MLNLDTIRLVLVPKTSCCLSGWQFWPEQNCFLCIWPTAIKRACSCTNLGRRHLPLLAPVVLRSTSTACPIFSTYTLLSGYSRHEQQERGSQPCFSCCWSGWCHAVTCLRSHCNSVPEGGKPLVVQPLTKSWFLFSPDWRIWRNACGCRSSQDPGA